MTQSNSEEKKAGFTPGSEETLFELVDQIGETLEGDLHVLDQSEDFPETEGESAYRVYHKSGYCFDVFKRANYDLEDDRFIGWEYDFSSEWEGVEKLTLQKAIELLQKAGGVK